MTKHKRLDGKKKQIAFTRQLEKDMSSFCRDKGIASESELIREAISKYIYADYQDETLKLQVLDTLRKQVEELRDMFELSFKYMRLMHINQLSYHAEIDLSLTDAAFESVNIRHNRFFEVFQDSLRNDPPFFERLLHKYYTGTNNG
jgi:hypothetical protein